MRQEKGGGKLVYNGGGGGAGAEARLFDCLDCMF